MKRIISITIILIAGTPDQEIKNIDGPWEGKVKFSGIKAT